MWMPSARSDVLVWWVTSNGPLPVATIGALYTTSEPAIRMNGLYPGPATAPGWNWASGNPSGPGVAMRVGLKSGAPAKLMTAGPNGFRCGVGLLSVTVCTHAGQPIVYLSTDAGQPLTAVLERSTYVPALNDASFNGGDDFLGSARERLFAFINGQTGVNNPQAQGFQHLALDGMVSKDASLGDTAFINALRFGGDLLNVFGDFPTLKDPRHAQAYSPLWDAQLGLWTPKAVQEGLNKRQIDENVVFNLADQRPDLLTGVNPATGQPQPYGSVGVDINCAVIGYTAKAPTANLAPPAPNSQFPPR